MLKAIVPRPLERGTGAVDPTRVSHGVSPQRAQPRSHASASGRTNGRFASTDCHWARSTRSIVNLVPTQSMGTRKSNLARNPGLVLRKLTIADGFPDEPLPCVSDNRRHRKHYRKGLMTHVSLPQHNRDPAVVVLTWSKLGLTGALRRRQGKLDTPVTWPRAARIMRS